MGQFQSSTFNFSLEKDMMNLLHFLSRHIAGNIGLFNLDWQPDQEKGWASSGRLALENTTAVMATIGFVPIRLPDLEQSFLFYNHSVGFNSCFNSHTFTPTLLQRGCELKHRERAFSVLKLSLENNSFVFLLNIVKCKPFFKLIYLFVLNVLKALNVV